MNKGIVRKIDSVGRILPPKEFRECLGWENDQRLDMYLEGDRLIVEKAKEAGCYCCGKRFASYEVLGVFMCKSCYDLYAPSIDKILGAKENSPRGCNHRGESAEKCS